MKKLILLVSVILCVNSFAVVHTYYFKISEVNTPANAKIKIDRMRTILGIKMFSFNDETDTFKTISEWEYNWQEMAEDLALHGIYIEGEVDHRITE